MVLNQDHNYLFFKANHTTLFAIVQEAQPIPGDLDDDLDVDAGDYSVFRTTLGKCTGAVGFRAEADYDGDGCITYADYWIWYGYCINQWIGIDLEEEVKMGKMRRFRSLSNGLLLAVFFLCLSATAAQAIPTVSLELSSSSITVGDIFDVYVIADGVDVDPFLGGDLLAFGFDLDYDMTEFLYGGAMVGTDFLDDSSIFPSTQVAGSTFPGIGGDGILLASLSFTSLLAGDLSLGIVSDLSDFNEGLTTFSLGQIDMTHSINASVSAAATPVPEPGAIFLVGTGLVGFAGAGIRRRFKRS